MILSRVAIPFCVLVISLGTGKAAYSEAGGFGSDTAVWIGKHESSDAWGESANWEKGTVPAFSTQTDLIWQARGAGRPNSVLGASDRTVRSLTFNQEVFGPVRILTQNLPRGTVARSLIFEAKDVGANASIVVLQGAEGDIEIGGMGGIVLRSPLEVLHHGAGLLKLDSILSGTIRDVTFAGSGRTRLGVNNTFTGNVHLNGGTVQFTVGGRFGDENNDLIFNGGRIQMVDVQTAVNLGNNRDLTLRAGGGTIDIAVGRILIVPGLLRGSGDLTVTGLGDGLARVRLDNTANVQH